MINPSTILQKYKEEQERKAKKARPGRSLALTKLEELNQVRCFLTFVISEDLLLSIILRWPMLRLLREAELNLVSYSMLTLKL